MPASTIDSFLTYIHQSLKNGDGKRVAEFLVLNFDNLAPQQQKPYGDLHTELNDRYPAGKDTTLSAKIKAALPTTDLKAIHASFCEAVMIYFRYVRDFTGDSGLIKARKIERLTKQCITSLREDPPGPTLIPIVLHLTSTLRQISVNLDRDPDLAGQSAAQSASGEDDIQSISYVEQTGNTLREAFNKCIARSRPTQPPSPTRLDSALYKLLNSTMRIYSLAGKLRNSEFLLAALDKTSPPLMYYPASQRVTFLFYLGLFFFESNHFFRAVRCLQAAYDQCAKHNSVISQRREILIYLIASSLCCGRLPHKILLNDIAAHSISKAFVILSQIIKSGDIGRFSTYLDHTLPANMSKEANWLLSKKVIIQLRNRCEILCWRQLVYRAMKYGGFLGSTEEGKQNSMPFMRLSVIHQAACFSYARARKAVYDQTAGRINLEATDDDEHLSENYVDPDFADADENDYGSEAETASRGSAPFTSTPNSSSPSQHESSRSHAALLDPTPAEINSVVLSLISQGFLRGFVHHTFPDLLASRFAIPGVRRPQTSRTSEQGSLWKEVGFPQVFEVVRSKEAEWEDYGADSELEVPGWVTEDKVRRRLQAASVGGGGGTVVRLSGARPVGMN